MIENIEIIAEVKTKSPYGFRSIRSWDFLLDIANLVGDSIAIHTDPDWGGGYNLITKARNRTNKFIIAKGIHGTDIHVERALDAGADYVLVVGRIPYEYMDRCVIEPLNLNQINFIPASARVVWNQRDLSTGKPKKETFEQARAKYRGPLCQASYISNINNINPRADAVLVGTNLVELARSIGYKIN